MQTMMKTVRVKEGLYQIWERSREIARNRVIYVETLVATVEFEDGDWYVDLFCDNGTVYSTDIMPSKQDSLMRAYRWYSLEDPTVTDGGERLARKLPFRPWVGPRR